VFVNPTLQDNFPTVNLEAIACGTPVVTYIAGGAGESQSDDSGYKVEKGNVKGLYDAVQKVKSGTILSENCRAQALNFKAKSCFEKYLEIYKDFEIFN